jgi:NTP pyrophosphatase (non-canonical NTP hydrolase)
MSDQTTSVRELRELVRQFVDQRNWQKFHAPKNLSMALAIEAAELMEHFQWLEVADSRKLSADPDKLNAVGEELADVLCYALAIANELELDVTEIMQRKMVKNREKYPVEDYRGRYGANDPGEVNEA